MKFLCKILIIIVLLISPAAAVTFDVLVLPADLLTEKENYYNFNEMSEIISTDIINNFNNSNGKIKSPALNEVRAKLNQNKDLKTLTLKALDNYYHTNKIDYDAFKKIGTDFSCKSVLIISSYVRTNKNSLKRGVWEVLEVSSGFDISYPYRLETSIVLLDTVNNLVMWSNNYSIKLGTNNNLFKADSYPQAQEWLEKLRLYSETIVAPGATQNITLRFFPKAIRPIETKVEGNTGGALKFDRIIPPPPRQKDKTNEEFYGDMIYGI